MTDSPPTAEARLRAGDAGAAGELFAAFRERRFGIVGAEVTHADPRLD